MRFLPIFLEVSMLCLITACVSTITPENEDNTEVIVPQGFVKVESTGSYTFLTTTANTAGGETVSIPAEYYICQYAVTNTEWKEYLDATHSSAPKYWTGGTIPEGREKHPVLWISCNEAEAYCK